MPTVSRATEAGGHARLVRVLHTSLLAGQIVIFAAFAFVVSRTGPLLGDAGTLVGQALTGVAVVQLAVTVLMLRPRVPERLSSVDKDAYWADARVRTPAQVVWVVAEAATFVALTGYLLTGMTMAGVVGLVGVATFAWLRPGSFER